METDHKVNILLKRLLEKTRSGDLHWGEGSEDTAFQISFPNSTIEIGGFESSSHYFIRVYNFSGKLIEVKRIGPAQGEYYTIIDDLYQVVRRQVFKIDETMDDILNHLK